MFNTLLIISVGCVLTLVLLVFLPAYLKLPVAVIGMAFTCCLTIYVVGVIPRDERMYRSAASQRMIDLIKSGETRKIEVALDTYLKVEREKGSYKAAYEMHKFLNAASEPTSAK